MLPIITVVLGILLAGAIVGVPILDRRNTNQAGTIESLSRELTTRGKDIRTLLIEQNKHRSLIRIGESDRADLREVLAEVEDLLAYERSREKIYLERVSEFHAVMNDGGLHAIFRMLKSAGMDPRKALNKFENEDGPFTANPTETRALADLRKKPKGIKPWPWTESPYDLSEAPKRIRIGTGNPWREEQRARR